MPLSLVAREAGVAMTTLHSFMRKEDAEMRTSNFEKIDRALETLTADSANKHSRSVREEADTFGGANQIVVTISMSAEDTEALRQRGLDVTAIARAGAVKAIRESEALAWRDANRDAIEAYNAWIAKHGTLAEQIGLI